MSDRKPHAVPKGEHQGKGVSVLPARTEARLKPAGRTLEAALGGEEVTQSSRPNEKEHKR